jgi:hypothetical protein
LALRIDRGSIADVDSLEPLWVGVHRVHAASMPELAPYVDDAETWSVRRSLYVSLFDKPATVLLLARDGEQLIGYALTHVLAVDDTWIADTEAVAAPPRAVPSARWGCPRWWIGGPMATQSTVVRGSSPGRAQSYPGRC